MQTLTINSAETLSDALGKVREAAAENKFLRLVLKPGKARSSQQNSFSHAWYGQMALELREDDAAGWKAYSKLHHGVPILRAEDEDFRAAYDQAIKPLAYEDKLAVMRFWPVTSLMTKKQLSAYADAVQADFAKRGVYLEVGCA